MITMFFGMDENSKDEDGRVLSAEEFSKVIQAAIESETFPPILR